METIGSLKPAAGASGFFRFASKAGEHVLVVPHTRIYDLTPSLVDQLDRDTQDVERLMRMLAETVVGEVSLDDIVRPSVQSLSLNVSSGCNLSCGYCYADRGSFLGRQAKSMSKEVAFAGIDALLEQADESAPITIGFLGGEPLINRRLMHDVVEYAESKAAARRLVVRFSITSNGTLMTEEDILLFRTRRFAVTVSIDGDALTHDQQRPQMKGNVGSFALLASRIAPLLADPGQAQISARMTVGRHSVRLRERLEAIWALGFQEAGVSPLRVAADHSELGNSDWGQYLRELIDVSKSELERAQQGLQIRLTNLAVALKQIHRGASSPYPCGAGGGYFSLSSSGKWYACHRAIGDSRFELGESGHLDEVRRAEFLKARHVHAQTDCSSCWARYLCSGSCHQEAGSRTVQSCDFIRDWLHFCLTSYCELSTSQPSYFAAAN